MGMGVKPGRKRIETLLYRSKFPLEETWESQQSNQQLPRAEGESPPLEGYKNLGDVALEDMGWIP